MSGKLDKLTSGVVAVAAVVVAASVVYRVFLEENAGPSETRSPEYVRDWESVLEAGIPLGGDTTAPITVVTFTDLECPACRAFHETLTALLGQRPRDVYVTYLGYPLDYHRFARAAAHAAECAYDLGAFRSWVDAVFQKQDSLGLKTWASYANDAGISPIDVIERCAARTEASVRQNAVHEFAARLDPRGVSTPTVLVNGWWFHNVPSRTELISAIDTLLAGRSLRR